MRSDEVTLGSAVLTFDDEDLGRVAAVRGEYFKVEGPRGDFWLAVRDATEIRSEHVRLGFPRDSLGEYKHEEPERG